MKIDEQEVFEQVGNALYAVAADQRVKPLEVAELKLLVARDWPTGKKSKKRHPVSDETHFILMTMDSLQGTGTTADDAFRRFENFYREKGSVLTSEMKGRLIRTAGDIVKIFQADDPAPNVQLRKLKEMLELRGTISMTK